MFLETHGEMRNEEASSQNKGGLASCHSQRGGGNGEKKNIEVGKSHTVRRISEERPVRRDKVKRKKKKEVSNHGLSHAK